MVKQKRLPSYFSQNLVRCPYCKGQNQHIIFEEIEQDHVSFARMFKSVVECSCGARGSVLNTRVDRDMLCGNIRELEYIEHQAAREVICRWNASVEPSADKQDCERFFRRIKHILLLFSDTKNSGIPSWHRSDLAAGEEALREAAEYISNLTGLPFEEESP